MIPKIIHYCWFGGNPKPEIIEKCIASWKKYCPDWEIVEWNESNYDVTAHPYTKEAYEAKKWAFVSDIARLEVIISQGGIYLDTDVEILTPLPYDEFQQYEGVLVFETERAISSGLLLGGCKNSSLCKALLEPYKNTADAKTQIVNSVINKPVFESYMPNLKWNGKTQVHNGIYVMGCDEYGKYMHHYGTRTWCDNLPKYKISGCWKLKRFLRNPNFLSWMEANRILRKFVPVYVFLVYDFLDLGPIYYVKRIALKVKNRKR